MEDSVDSVIKKLEDLYLEIFDFEKIKFDRKNIKRLTHYAHYAGKIKEFNTGINIEDKINFVWPLQTGLITYMEALKIARHKIKMSVQKVDLPP